MNSSSSAISLLRKKSLSFIHEMKKDNEPQKCKDVVKITFPDGRM